MAITGGAIGPVELNSKTIQEMLDGGYGVAQMLDAEGSAVLSAALASAPVVTGNYVSHMFIRTSHTDRMLVQVGNDAEYAKSVERRHSVLTKALGASSGKRGRSRKKK